MYSPYKCKTCSKGFSTNSHLRRHEASHIGSRSHSCFFCDQYFSRIDAARRHARKCPHRGNRPMPHTIKRGKSRTSCDYCAMAKVACDEGVPCGTCLSSSFVCRYSRVSGTIQPDSPQLPNISPSEDEDTTADTMECQMSPATQESTDTAYKDFYTALESGRPEPVQRCGLSTKPTEVLVMSSDFVQASLPEESCESFPFFGFPGVDSWSQEFFDGKVSETMAEPQLFCFRKRGEEIVKELSCTADYSGMSTEGARDRLYSAIEQGLFSVPNLVEYTQLYLQCLRRHCPIIDLPTSRISSVSSPLLLAMLLGGSILSYPRDTYHLAIECFDLAEEYIFGLPIFKAGCKDPGAPESRMPDLAESLMAAIVIINIQVGRNDPGIRRRIRHQRFAPLVYAARSLSLFQITHQNTSLQPVLNGLTFTQKESLIRTATYIFLLDCQFVACFRSPPLITIAELTGDLPCYEVDFSTEGSSLPTATDYRRSPSLVGVVETLMDDSQEKLDSLLTHRVSVFGLFAVICGLHSMIFSALASNTIRIQLARLRRALSRWHLLWESTMSQTSKDELRLIGFMMCGEEIWLLARALLQIDAKEFVQGLDCYSMASFVSLLRQAHEISRGPYYEMD